jgi:hypothetical protein
MLITLSILKLKDNKRFLRIFSNKKFKKFKINKNKSLPKPFGYT